MSNDDGLIDFALEIRDMLRRDTGDFSKREIIAAMTANPARVDRLVYIDVARLKHAEIMRAASVVCDERRSDGLKRFPAYTKTHRRAENVYSDPDKSAMRRDYRRLQVQENVLAIYREGDVMLANDMQRALTRETVPEFILRQSADELESLGATEDAARLREIAANGSAVG